MEKKVSINLQNIDHLTFPLYQSWQREPEKALFLLKGKGMQELPPNFISMSNFR
ncbi:hypothetical protein LAD67_17720 [Escherichia coli]|nr:hypothetical protein [Escherichia coli]